jgi:hypothetical protein
VNGDREEALAVEAWLHTFEGDTWHRAHHHKIKYSSGAWASFKALLAGSGMHWKPESLIESLVGDMPPVTDEDIERPHP